MWFPAWQLHAAGFRRRSRFYWRCERRHGLPANAHVSIFAAAGCAASGRVAVHAFHVTFVVGMDHLHFYYHEAGEGVWEAGGHTSSAEIARHGVDPAALRAIADGVAAGVATGLGGALTGTLPGN